jgi:hypothetical protein
MKDFLTNEKDKDRDDFTNMVFDDYKEFEKEVQKVFGDTDEKLYV